MRQVQLHNVVIAMINKCLEKKEKKVEKSEAIKNFVIILIGISEIDDCI